MPGAVQDPPATSSPRRSPWPVVTAVVAVLTVVLAVFLARPAAPTLPPLPLPVDPSPPDRIALSLDRCAAALAVAELADGFPDRERWEPVARRIDTDVVAAVLGGPVPFVCATGPTTVEVSDPDAAVPIGAARLLLTAPSGLVAAAAAPGGTVAAGGGAPGVAVLARGAAPADPAAVVLEVDGAPARPDRLAPPLLRVEDRREIPIDQSAEAATLLARCQGAAPADRFWQPAVVLPHDDADVLVVSASAVVGGCTVAPGRAEPVALWRVGTSNDGPRPFYWVTAPPGAPADVAGGPAQPRMVRLELTAPDGRTWTASLGGRAFVTRLPPGVVPDPGTITARAYDADGALLYEGPAA